jgi:hypothetical protein
MVLEKGFPGNLFSTISTPFDWQKKIEDFFCRRGIEMWKTAARFFALFSGQ